MRFTNRLSCMRRLRSGPGTVVPLLTRQHDLANRLRTDTPRHTRWLVGGIFRGFAR